MGTLSVLLALCEGYPPVTSGYPSQRASNTGFDVFFNVSLYQLLQEQSRAGDLRRHDGRCDVIVIFELLLFYTLGPHVPILNSFYDAWFEFRSF